MSSSTDRLAGPVRENRAGTRLGGLTAMRVAVGAAVAALVLVPLGAIVVLAAGGRHLPTLLEGDVLEAGRGSLVSAVLSAVGAVALGTLLAVLLERTDLPFRRALRLFALSPMLVPPFVGAIAWIGLAGPTSAINLWWRDLFGGPLWIVYGGDGVVFLLIVHSYPIAMLVVSAALRRIPADLEQAARISGASAVRALATVTVPLLRPALASAFTLIAVSTAARAPTARPARGTT